ncbi:hypothetical protein AAC387_Pa11g0332 [Persea americana]
MGEGREKGKGNGGICAEKKMIDYGYLGGRVSRGEKAGFSFFSKLSFLFEPPKGVKVGCVGVIWSVFEAHFSRGYLCLQHQGIHSLHPLLLLLQYQRLDLHQG